MGHGTVLANEAKGKLKVELSDEQLTYAAKTHGNRPIAPGEPKME